MRLVIRSFIENHQFIAGILASILAGAVLWLFRNAPPVFAYIWRRFFVRDILHGLWYVYHWTTDSNGVMLIREERWIVSLGLRARYKVTCTDPQRPGLVYIGTIENASHGHLLAQMHGKLHNEEYTIRILEPIPSRATETCGLKVGIDFRSRIFSTVYFYSRDPLSLALARDRIRQRIEQDPERRLFLLGTAVPTS